MYKINSELIERSDERTFFNPRDFKIIRLNRSAYRLMDLCRTPISETDFLDGGVKQGFTPDFLRQFMQRCTSSKLIIEASS